jgi:hypothetical protein
MIGKKQIHNNLKILLLSLSSLILISCSTEAYRTSGYDYSAEDMQKAIQDNIPVGIGAVTPNGRGFYSKVFTQDQQGKGSIPLVMRFDILGDRRPYDMDVAVKKVSPGIHQVDSAFENGETFVGQDSLAKRIVRKIGNQLALRRKDKNLFDDFRPF